MKYIGSGILLIVVFAVVAGFVAVPGLKSLTPAVCLAESARQAVIIDGPSNVRSGPGTNYRIIFVLQTGEKVMIYGGSVSGWYKTYINDARGYIHQSQLRFSSTGGGSSTSGSYRWAVVFDGPTNVRSGPGSSYSIVSVLETGERVKVYGATQNGWYIIYVNGRKAYVHKSQLNLQ